ncbi:hypothetical protein AJ88_03065 [Mesorhizobium amorphae CCBAU 01583]|nr:hypothetical protein AJ88_03065 [Mesorhizobium amorphae CCBAU 01583]
MLATPHFAADQDHVDGGRRSILGNFRSVFIGRLFSSLSMWLALMLLAKLSDPTTVGIYALAQALCIPIGEVAKWGCAKSTRAAQVGLISSTTISRCGWWPPASLWRSWWRAGFSRPIPPSSSGSSSSMR